MINHRLHSRVHTAARTTSASRRTDRGNVLPMVLVMMVVGSLMVTALLTFAITLLRNRPPLEERSDSLEAVRSAMRMAIVMQRDHGPEGCYEASNPGFLVNDRNVTVDCQTLAFENDNGGRFGLIATTNNGLGNGNLPSNEAVDVGTGNATKEVLGSVFLNGGQLAGANSGLSLADGRLVGSTYSSSATSPHRYSQVDIATDYLFPVGTTCSNLFGPDVLEQTIDGLLLNDAVYPIRSSARAGGVRVERNGSGSPAMILGVMVYDDASNVRLVRQPTNESNQRFDVAIPLLMVGQPVTACYQEVPATDPTYIERGFTTCDGPLVDPELVEQSAAAGDGITCEPVPWWTYAGWKPQLLPDYIYPMLPQVPSYARSSTPYPIGANCNIFYPGRYNGPVELLANQNYYFASGVYLFNDTITMQPGSTAVAGEGSFKGCAFDADAAFLSGTPRNHEITGKGATFLLGSDVTADSGAVPSNNGKIVVNSASLRINERVATTSTRASSGISVMSVNLARVAASPDDVEIPSNDRVLLPGCLASDIRQQDIDAAAAGTTNPCATDVDNYSITPTAAIGAVRYTKSGLGPDDAIISAQLDGNDVNRNRIMFGGNIFVPNAKVDISRSVATDDYAVVLGNGAVASSFRFDIPTGDDTNFVIGQDTAASYQRVRLVATTTFNGQDFRSVAELEVDAADRYAINNWTVDAGSGDLTGGSTGGGSTGGGSTDGSTTGGTPAGGTTDGSTTGGTTTSGTTDGSTTGGTTTSGTTDGSTTGGTTTSGTTDGSTTGGTTGSGGVTDGGTDAGTTGGGTTGGSTGGTDGGTTGGTDGGTTPDPCLADDSWTAEWWNNRDLSGTPDAVTNPVAISNNWGNGSPMAGINNDNFSVRWTRKITVPVDGNYRFTIGADDGYRLKVDGGPWLTDNWDDHAYESEDVVIPLTAGCSHEIVMEYYERGGQAVANLSYSLTPTLPNCPNAADDLWSGRYYNDTNYSRSRNSWSSYKYTTSSAAIDFDWGNGSPNEGQLGNNTYSIRWSKTVNLDQPGNYRFSGGGNNGYRLFVNGTEVFGDWGNGGYSEDSGTIQITERCGVELVYEYYENSGSAEVWFGPIEFLG